MKCQPNLRHFLTVDKVWADDGIERVEVNVEELVRSR